MKANLYFKSLALLMVFIIMFTSSMSAFAGVAGERFSDSQDFKDKQFEGALDYLVNKGILLGKSNKDGTLKVAINDNVSRAEFVTLIVRGKILAEYEKNNKVEVQKGDLTERQINDILDNKLKGFKTNFIDIKGHWAEKYIEFAESLSLDYSFSDKIFEPDKSVTFEEMCSIIYNASKGITNETSNEEPDISKYVLDEKKDDNLFSSIYGAIKSGILGIFKDNPVKRDSNHNRLTALILARSFYKAVSVNSNSKVVLTLKVDKANGITLLWNGIPFYDYYTVNLKKDNGKYEEILKGSKETFLLYDKLSKDSLNFFKVTAKSIDGNTIESNEVVFGYNGNTVIIDSDQDGMLDSIEKLLGTSEASIDTDNDGLNDMFEIAKAGTNPSKKDTDDNKINDNDEDSDNDQIKNIDEQLYGTHPLLSDTDKDDLKDNEEINSYHTSCIIADTDKDGMDDGSEVRLGFNPLDRDSNDNGIIDSQESTVQKIDNTILSTMNVKENNAIPEISIHGKGDINKNIKIQNLESNPLFKDNRAIVGYPIDVELNNSFEYADVKFSINKDYLQRSKSNLDNLVICWYDEKNNCIEPVETTRNQDTMQLVAKVNHFSTYFVLNTKAISYELGNMTNGYKINSQVDMVFVIDSTSSMQNEINNVKNNIKDFVQSLYDDKVSISLALVEYKDIVSDGLDSTKVHRFSDDYWTMDPNAFISQLTDIRVNGGGDSPETLIDAIETARNIRFRENANKHIVVLTDDRIKVNNRYGINDIDEEIEKLKSDNIITSIIGPESLRSYYKNIYSNTEGIFANVNGNFSAELGKLKDRVKNTDEGNVWVLLSNLQEVKLKKIIDTNDTLTDTDGDGIPDIKELKSTTPRKVLVNGIEMQVFDCISNPSEADSDFDGVNDFEEMRNNTNPLVNDLVALKEEYKPIEKKDMFSDFFQGIGDTFSKSYEFVVDKTIRLLTWYVKSQLINLAPYLVITLTDKELDELSRGLVLGYINGIVIAIKGDIEAIAAVPDLLSGAYNAAAGLFDFCNKFTFDEKYRNSVFKSIDDIIDNFKEMWDQREAIIGNIIKTSTEEMEKVSKLRSSDEGFVHFTTGYIYGTILGIITEAVLISKGVGYALKAMKSIKGASNIVEFVRELKVALGIVSKAAAEAINKLKAVTDDFLNNIRYIFRSGDEVLAYMDGVGPIKVSSSEISNIAKMENMADSSGKLLNAEIRPHTSMYLGHPTQSELYELMRKKNISSLSEASAYWYVDKQTSTKSLIPGEADIKKFLGIDTNAPGENMVDLLKMDNTDKLVPIEIKNQTTIDLVEGSNCAANKFSNIAKKANMNEVTHFEIICNEASKLPPNFMSDSSGKLYQLISGSNPPEWIEWKFGNKNVFVRKADLGNISQ